MARTLSDTERQAQPALQSDGERDDGYRSDMPVPIRAVLWKNLEALMTAQWGGANLNRLAREAGIGTATMARLKTKDQNIGVEMLLKLGRPFRRQPWELLSPSLSGYSAAASEIAAAFDEITDDAVRRRAYALIVQILEFGNMGGAPPSPPPSPEPDLIRQTPLAEAPPAPAPKRTRAKAR